MANKKRDHKEQLQEDILTILEGFEICDMLDGEDYNNLVTALCDSAIQNVDRFTQKDK